MHIDTEIHDQLEDSEIEAYLEPRSATEDLDMDRVENDLDIISNPTQKQSSELAFKSSNHAHIISKKAQKISVAPGEDGSFQNWGSDIFLEEKCFPEKFPYGTGGYLSSSVEDPEKAIGFAEYCVSQIMSCDPKFRMDVTYIFFLLLVKELIQIKRCINTYFRQATMLPTVNKENLSRISPEDLIRYNRTYKVFKSLRGTCMYFEECKHNLMALIRQLGCPTAFLTLSCAELG